MKKNEFKSKIILNTKDVAEILGRTQRNVIELIRSRKLKAKRIGRSYGILKEELTDFIDPNCIKEIK